MESNLGQVQRDMRGDPLWVRICNKMGIRGIFSVISIIAILIQLAIVVAVVWVLVHFAHKYW